jgi:hypothetical protein
MDFILENWGVVMGFMAAAVVLFTAVAKRTANKTDDKIAKVLKRWLRMGGGGALAVLLAAWLTLGCATRVSTGDPFLTVVWGDAYTLEGEMVVSADGVATCTSDDCIEVRGGNIGENATAILNSIIAVGVGFLPGGPDGHTHTASQ